MQILIRPERATDQNAVQQINHLAFGGAAEARLVAALRDGGYVSTSLVAEVCGTVVGLIVFSRVSIRTNSGVLPAAALAPLAVLPEFQRQGIGSALVRAGIEDCRRGTCCGILVLGHPDFYPRFGFSAELAETLESPFGGGPAWMALELTAGALHGRIGSVTYAPPFLELA